MVDEHREIYRGRNITIRPAAEPVLGAPSSAEDAGAELYIDDEPIFTLRDGAGMYLASGFAYEPQSSLVDVGKRIVDYREATQEQEHDGSP
jgi:hypothetical protein